MILLYLSKIQDSDGLVSYKRYSLQTFFSLIQSQKVRSRKKIIKVHRDVFSSINLRCQQMAPNDIVDLIFCYVIAS